MSVPKYEPGQIEKKWQEKWEADGIYRAREDDPRPKRYELTMFPYTSGNLHIGHWFAMVPADVHARFRRMQGFNVMHPMGFDAFGLPAENAAISRGIHPHTWTMNNVVNMRRQLRSMGASYDWDREVVSCLPDYYKWTEWFFLKLYKAGLAYRAKAPANWCPKCQTVLANEQVVDNGSCERCHTPVIRRDMEQWFFRITKYADEMMDHSKIDWPERVKTMQRNWIGRSEGTEISFDISHYGLEQKDIRVFTTRADTIFGVTFMVLAPEHPLVAKLTTPDRKAEVDKYVDWARHQTEIERQSTEREKTGVFTGAHAINRLNGQQVPIWIADYVLVSYGTGAVMAVPAHDTRDFEFARKFNVPIQVVISPPEWNGGELAEAYTGEGNMVNSGRFDGLSIEEGVKAVGAYLKENGWGGPTVSYRLRDWLISRQRYWGAPIPMVYCDLCGIVPVPEDELPVMLPEDAEFKPTGESPLKYCADFVNTICPKCGGKARRETDTMDTFMCSSWYFLRYASPKYDKGAFDPEKVKFWLPVDLYTGGVEHANMHLFYSRFFVKAIRDIGLIDFDEPFLKLFNQGTIVYQKHKMSKSRGNVVSADDYVGQYGADSMRAYLMFVGPWDLGGEWNDSGINGMWRWLNRVWNLVLEPPAATGQADPSQVKELRHWTHKTIKKVSDDLENFRFNTMLAALMEFTNYLGKAKETAVAADPAWKDATEALMLMVAPSVPHMAEELWQLTAHGYSVHQQRFPSWEQKLAAVEEITLVVQVNGKVRDKVTVAASISEAEAKDLALGLEKVKTFLDNKQVANVIYVPGRLVNVVVK